MTELIDKRELLNALNTESMKHHKSTIPMVEHDFRELINKMPTVDAVPVVRCKDCKYWHPHTQCGFDYDNDEYHDYCGLLIPDDDYYAEPVSVEHYCSKGERKRKDGTK